MFLKSHGQHGKTMTLGQQTFEADDIGTGEAGQHWKTMTLEQEKLGSIGRP